MEMDIKAVFFDLDGTLFTGTRSVAPSTRVAIDELKRKDILVGIATGRGPAFALPLMEELHLDFAVTYNGQYIFTPKAVLHAEEIDKRTLRKIVRFAKDNHRDISLGAAHGVNGSKLLKFGETRMAGIISGILPSGTSDIARNSFKHVVRRVVPQSNFLNILREPIYQVMMVATQSETEMLEKEFPNLMITRSNPYSVDMIPCDSGKLRGIKMIGERYGFNEHQVMAFGDSENDLEMLTHVEYGIAMGNASDLVKQKATHVTTSNNHDGIAKALAHYGLIDFSTSNNFISRDQNFNKVKEFHKMMDGRSQEIPRAFPPLEAGYRAGFKVEEIVEFLYASANGDSDKFDELTANLHADVDKAVRKVKRKAKEEAPLIGEVDALIDLLYFTYGSLVLAGVDPYDIFNFVHAANMGKIFPDGQPHFDPETHKILKPDDWEEKYAPEGKIERELERQKRIALRKARVREEDNKKK